MQIVELLLDGGELREVAPAGFPHRLDGGGIRDQQREGQRFLVCHAAIGTGGLYPAGPRRGK